MSITLRSAFAVGGAVMLAPMAAAEIGSATDLVPENSVVVMTMRGARATYDRFQETPLWNFMRQDEVQDMMSEMMEELSSGFGELLGEDDVDPTFMIPSGSVAFGLYPVLNRDAGVTLPAFFIAGDFGDDAEQTWERIQTIVQEQEDDAPGRLVEDEIAGRKVWTINAYMDDMDDDMGGGMGMGMDPMAMGAALAEGFTKTHLTREGSWIMLSSDEGVLRRAFDIADGGSPQRYTERDDVQALMDRMGDRDFSFTMTTKHLGALIAGADPMGISMMAGPMFGQFIGSISGIASGTTIDGPDAMVQNRTFIHMPNGKSGLSALLDDAAPVGDIPSFVPADAMSYNRMRFEFDGLAQLVGSIANTAAMMGAPIGGQDGVAQMQAMVTQFTDAMGEEIHMIGPSSGGESLGVTAIECTNPQAMDQLLSQFGAMMGMEGRDFLGNRLYTMDPAAMSMMMPMGGMGGGMGAEVEPVGFGLAGGHMMVGSQSAVESAMRLVGDAGGDSLADQPGVRAAMEAMAGKRVVGWGWQDTAESMLHQMTTMQEQMEEMQAQMAEMDPAFAAEMGMPAELETMMDLMNEDMVRSMFGDSIWTLLAEDDGFVMDAWQFAPSGG